MKTNEENSLQKEVCRDCGGEPIYIDGLCDDCYQLKLMDYAVSQGKKVFTTYDGKKLYE